MRQCRPLKKKPKPRQGRRGRVDPFEVHSALIPQSWEVEPNVGSQKLLQADRLDPESYGPQNKRTLQREIRDWRVDRVQQTEQKPKLGQKKMLPGVNQRR